MGIVTLLTGKLSLKEAEQFAQAFGPRADALDPHTVLPSQGWGRGLWAAVPSGGGAPGEGVQPGCRSPG